MTGKEQYYTPSEVAQETIARIHLTLPLDATKPFLEPAGGTGAFVNAAHSLGFRKLFAFDIEPKHPQVQLANFLEQDLDFSNGICVSNPPFGRNNALAIPFFNHAAKFCDTIGFVVPQSWRKWSVINRLDSRYHLLADWDLAIDYVDQFGEPTLGKGGLRTCLQLWQRSKTHTRNLVKIPNFNLVTRATPAEADVSITQFGYGCGTIKTEFPRTPNTTQLFLKINRPDVLDALRAIDFSCFTNHTATTQAISFQEINFLLNNHLGLDLRQYSLDSSNEHYLGLSYSKLRSTY